MEPATPSSPDGERSTADGERSAAAAVPTPYAVPVPPPQPAYPPVPYAPPQVVVAPKSAGIAYLLSFLWLGAGNLYAGQLGLGVALIVTNAFLMFFGLIGLVSVVLAIVVVPLVFVGWLVLFLVSGVTAAGAVNQANARLGLPG
ncbi:TM2 domain-containing protein [Motilibacter deserti]|uniref:TM2 domain-containing protein n=1 Tax=Motilibacter deserti TaxID=2714956 RepID=A0ABX0GPI3_9ACTN|nr:TM2 domain-containing protein [Motilibacter deserti]NHC12622.1 TM2 domain-containing protein [Motilibacter deserti]